MIYSTRILIFVALIATFRLVCSIALLSERAKNKNKKNQVRLFKESYIVLIVQRTWVQRCKGIGINTIQRLKGIRLFKTHRSLHPSKNCKQGKECTKRSYGKEKRSCSRSETRACRIIFIIIRILAAVLNTLESKLEK